MTEGNSAETVSMVKKWILVQDVGRAISTKVFYIKEELEKEVASLVSDPFGCSNFMVISGYNLKHCDWSLSVSIED